MQPESLIYREEVIALLFAIADMNKNIEEIRDLLEEEDGGEAEGSEEDA